MTRYLEDTVKHVLLLAAAALVLLPLAWMVATSFKTAEGVFSGPLLWPNVWNWDGYRRVFQEVPLMRWAGNSLIIAVLQTFGQLTVGVLAAYAFAHFRFPGRDALFFFVLLTMMLPEQVTMVPTYLLVKQFNLLDSFAGVVMPHLASGYAIFLLRQSFLTVPRELGDAAEIDGCNAIRSLWHVYLRLAGPVLGALTIILFVGIWNDYQWPLLVLNDKLMLPITVALNQFRQEESLEYVPTMAVATLSMVPVVALFLAAQRYFVEGFAHSGLKG
jgi:multiple sugar transport system permease protein/sn-glycerol 3-phosphate transport system permease protein